MEKNWLEPDTAMHAVQSISHSSQIPDYDELPVDRWIAASLLQKAIRRGQVEHAQRAAKTLLVDHPSIFWRRIMIIGWEDVAFGDLEGCFAATAASGSTAIRNEFGSYRLAACLVERLCAATKNRAADDVVTVIENDLEELRRAKRLSSYSHERLWATASSPMRSITLRSVAAWLLLGTTTIPCEFLPKVKGNPRKFFGEFPENQMPKRMRLFADVAVRRSRTLLPATIALLWEEYHNASQSQSPVQDKLLAMNLVGEVPEYAFDGHTRAGCRYLRKVGRTDAALADWLEQFAEGDLRLPMLKKFFFRAVSSQCDRRQNWGCIEPIRKKADSVGFGLEPKNFQEGLEIFREALRAYPVRELL